MKLSLQVLDICYPDYFQGWSPEHGPHFAVPVDQWTTWRDAIDDLRAQLTHTDELPDETDLPTSEVERALAMLEDGILYLSVPVDRTARDETYLYVGCTLRPLPPE